jgi:hypothetical protein
MLLRATRGSRGQRLKVAQSATFGRSGPVAQTHARNAHGCTTALLGILLHDVALDHLDELLIGPSEPLPAAFLVIFGLLWWCFRWGWRLAADGGGWRHLVR